MTLDEVRAALDQGVIPTAHCIGYDTLVPIVHPSNPVDDITPEELRDIYAGRIGNWSDLGGADAPILRTAPFFGSRLVVSFERIVMQGQESTEDILERNPGMSQDWLVSQNPDAIGYAAPAYVTLQAKALSVGGVRCTPKAVRTGRYPLTRPVFIYTDGYPERGSPVHRIVSFFYTREATLMLYECGMVPVTEYRCRQAEE